MEAGSSNAERFRQAERRLDTGEGERRELWRSQARQDRELAVIGTQLEGMGADVAAAAADSRKTREWVEARDRERDEAARVQQTLSAGQKAAITAGVFLIVSTLITTIATLANAGAFG